MPCHKLVSEIFSIMILTGSAVSDNPPFKWRARYSQIQLAVLCVIFFVHCVLIFESRVRKKRKVSKNVWQTETKMERKCCSAGADHHHLCGWRQCDRFCCKKDHECFAHSPGLALDDHLHFASDHCLANRGNNHQHFLWTV